MNISNSQQVLLRTDPRPHEDHEANPEPFAQDRQPVDVGIQLVDQDRLRTAPAGQV